MNSDYSSALGIGGGLFATCCWFLGLLVGIFVLVALWKVYVKAGKPGWAVIIPIYNILCCWRSWANRGGGCCSCSSPS